MKRYAVCKLTAEVRKPAPGCVIREDYHGDEWLGVYDTEAEAWDAIKAGGYRSEAESFHAPNGLWYKAVEYGIEIFDADDSGNFLSGSDYWFLPHMDIR